jgi:hypothetical protein
MIWVSFGFFYSEHELISSLPLTAIKVLKAFKRKNKIFLPSIFPLESDYTKYRFDIDALRFHGPFEEGGSLFIEQQQENKPKFVII